MVIGTTERATLPVQEPTDIKCENSEYKKRYTGLQEKYNLLLEKYNDSLENKLELEAKMNALRAQVAELKSQNYRLNMYKWGSPERHPDSSSVEDRGLNSDFLRMSALLTNGISKEDNAQEEANINAKKQQIQSLRHSIKMSSFLSENEHQVSSPILKGNKKLELLKKNSVNYNTLSYGPDTIPR